MICLFRENHCCGSHRQETSGFTSRIPPYAVGELVRRKVCACGVSPLGNSLILLYGNVFEMWIFSDGPYLYL